ncbi:MAG: hypothetical protein FWF22_10115, partial [Treponema sp.]|nr:hypothetical protein [Treponema sp.]
MEKMKDLDIEQFWKDDEIAHGDNCFAKDATQVALGIRMSDECFRDELEVDIDPWQPNPPELMQKYAKRYNDKAEKIVGKRLLREEYHKRNELFPEIKRIGDIFGGRYFYHNGSEYLEGTIQTAADLEKVLDRVDKTDIEEFVMPPDWDSRVKSTFEKTGIKPDPRQFGRHIRGPCTLAASLMGTSNFIYFLYDEPE